MTDQEHRRRFESWITAPPYERTKARFPDYIGKTAWPGQYRDNTVQIAWESWCQCAKEMAREEGR